MFASPRTLIIPLDGAELAVTVDGADALLAVGPAGQVRDPEPAEPLEPAEDRTVLRLRVPARALVAAVRVAWADEHDRGRFEPWRSRERPSHGRHAYGYDAEYDRWDDAFEDGYARYGYVDHRWDDDLGDGDHEGFRDPTVVPFPYRPTVAPTPARSGALWEPHEHRTLREMWFAAAPDADRNELLRDIAIRLERGVGGVAARLRVAGCDPTRPGSPWDASWAPDGPETDAEPEPTPVSLDGSG